MAKAEVEAEEPFRRESESYIQYSDREIPTHTNYEPSLSEWES